jgi:hypothetical protein
MGSHDPFGHFKHVITIKSQESPRFLHMQVVCEIPLKNLAKGYNFASNLISIRGLHAKLQTFKVAGVLVMGISGPPLGSLWTKWHLGAGLVARHTVYYKGEGDDFPQVWAVVNLMSPNLFVACPSNKSPQAMH